MTSEFGVSRRSVLADIGVLGVAIGHLIVVDLCEASRRRSILSNHNY